MARLPRRRGTLQGWERARAPSLLLEGLPGFEIPVEIARRHHPHDELLRVEGRGTAAHQLLADVRAAAVAHDEVDRIRDAPRHVRGKPGVLGVRELVDPREAVAEHDD